LAIETGWPPPPLLVMVTNATGTRPGGSATSAASRARSMLPLNGCGAARSRLSGQGRSSATAPAASMFARVVSKWVLFGTTSPLRSMVAARIRSAARPWWVGTT
jgi:hypothetical protein